MEYRKKYVLSDTVYVKMFQESTLFKKPKALKAGLWIDRTSLWRVFEVLQWKQPSGIAKTQWYLFITLINEREKSNNGAPAMH